MSFHTMIWIQPSDLEPFPLERAVPATQKFLDEHGVHQDTIKSLREACASPFAMSRPTLFFLDSGFLAILFDFLARQLPDISFAVRGVGEESRDIWIREFSNGELQFEAGPFYE